MTREVVLATIAAALSGCVATAFPDRSGDEQVRDEDIHDTAVAPAPVSGGTLAVSRDGRTVYASDPDADRVYAVDVIDGRVRFATQLSEGDEPGRIVEDATGRVHVALRRGGAVASFDPAYAQDVRRTSVCAEPRGIAYDSATGQVHVACTSGELVSLRASDGVEVRRMRLEQPDLRDVIVQNGQVQVTTFKSAELFTVLEDGSTTAPRRPADFNNSATNFVADVAWRSTTSSDGSVVMVHQRAADLTLPTGAGAYYSTVCDSGVVHSSISIFRPGQETPDRFQMLSHTDPSGDPNQRVRGTLPVDIAVSDGGNYAVAAAGSGEVIHGSLGSLQTNDNAIFACELPDDSRDPWRISEPIAVAFLGETLVVQARNPSRIVVNGRDGENAIPLEGPIHTSAGSDLFHGAVPATSVACASCHPEGREDGRVWHFDLGDRRTQSVSGGVLGTIPLHWGGDLPDMNALIQETLVNRMLGETPSDARVASLSTWLDQLPEPQAAPEQDADAVERGRALFEGAANCSGCHAGEALTNDATVDVGTGGRFQVPSLLGVSARAPFLHDGAAQTLTDRFNPAIGGGDLHGHTSQLDEAQISDLVAYLETL